MRISHLREFTVLATSHSVHAAAIKLHLAQSTLSKHLSELESETGLTLLRRTVDGVELTPAGRDFFEGVVTLLDSYDRILLSARSVQQKSTNIVRVGGQVRTPAVADRISEAIVRIAEERLPAEVELYGPHDSGDLSAIVAHEPLNALRRGLIDVAVLALCQADLEDSDFQYRFLYREALAYFATKNHPLAQHDTVSLADLQSDVFTLHAAYPRFAECILETCRRSGFEPKTRTRVPANFGEALSQIHDGEILCLPESDVYHVPPSDVCRLIQLKVDDLGACCDVWAVYLKNGKNPGVPIFVDALEGVCREASEQLPGPERSTLVD